MGILPVQARWGDGGVWKYDIRKGKWTDISPVRLPGGEKAGFGYAVVSVDACNPKYMIASMHSWGKHGYKSDEMFRTVAVARTGNQFSRQDMRMIILRLPIQKSPSCIGCSILR